MCLKLNNDVSNHYNTDTVTLRHNLTVFYDPDKPETAVSRWSRAKIGVAKIGKGLSKDKMAQQLYHTHWLEAVDPCHRYGCKLKLYYQVWLNSPSTQPFFYWLDFGDGKEVNLEKCSRSDLQRQCVKYLGPKERAEYEVRLEDGKMEYSRNGEFVETKEGEEWIYVVSPMRVLYVAQKEKGHFHHSSFLAGGATIAAGRLAATNGVIKTIWLHSGHYRPSEEHSQVFLSFLEEHHIDTTNVKIYNFKGEEIVRSNIQDSCNNPVMKKEIKDCVACLIEDKMKTMTNPINCDEIFSI